MTTNAATKQLESGHVYLDAENVEGHYALQNGVRKAHIVPEEDVELVDWWDPDKEEVGGKVPKGDGICGRTVLGRSQKKVSVEFLCRDCFDQFVQEER